MFQEAASAVNQNTKRASKQYGSMEPVRPPVNFFDHPQWRWPAWNFGLECEDLFSTLHYKYNTYESPLQDFEAFHLDVWEVANQASSVDEFHRLLAARKQLRLKELLKCFNDVAMQLTARPHLSPDDTWPRAVQLFSTKSLDSLVAYFAAFVPIDESPGISAPRKDAAGNPLTSNTAPTKVRVPSTTLEDSADDAEPKITLYSPPSERKAPKRPSLSKTHYRVTKRSQDDLHSSKPPKRSASKAIDQTAGGTRYHLRPRATCQSGPFVASARTP